jgi:hypothetical protein
MENKDIVNFSKFFERNSTTKLSEFKKENFEDFFLRENNESDDEFSLDTTKEIEKEESKVKPLPSFDPPVDPEKFIIDEEEIDEIDFEDSLGSYNKKNNFTKVDENLDDYYAVYKDKNENFSCDVNVEGAKLDETRARLILESDDWTLMFSGNIDRNGKCIIPLKKLNILDEGQVGKIKLEIIAENTVFIPWESDFKVKMSKKVTVQMPNTKKQETPQPLKESRVSVRVRK